MSDQVELPNSDNEVSTLLTDNYWEELKTTTLKTMRNRNTLIFLTLLSSALVMLWLAYIPLPDLHLVMTSASDATHRTLHRLSPSSIHRDSLRELVVDGQYLTSVGFVETPRIYGEASFNDSYKPPVFVSAIYWKNVQYTKDFLGSVRRHLPKRKMIIYDLGLSYYDKKQFTSLCNSTNGCLLRPFEFSKYPYHVQYMEIRAYLPIILQDALNDFGGIIWVDTSKESRYLIKKNLTDIIKHAQKTGLVAWTIDDPTSALSHPKMFSYFKTKQDNFYFHRMISTKTLVMYNTKMLHFDIMEPWLRCALIEECIRPTGAKNTACNYNRKPLYRYSGCHRYEMSALNIVLGIVFQFDCAEYTTKVPFLSTQAPNITYLTTSSPATTVKNNNS